MSLHTLEFEFKSAAPRALPVEWQHCGVTGSGDLEVLIERHDFGGAVKAKVVTPVSGFDKVWERVLAKFVDEFSIGDVQIEINDDNATPIVVYMRLQQTLAEAGFMEVAK